jgi:hypothetical protein
VIAVSERRRHKEVWRLLPWMANGRLAPAEWERAEAHVRQCKACEREFELQRRMLRAFTAPDRVIYAPGPSFRKLMDRIDSDGSEDRAPKVAKAAARSRPVTSLVAKVSHVSLWRPPGLAWAASFLLLFCVTGTMFTAYHWLDPVYITRSDPQSVVNPNVLHIAVDRSMPIGEVEELLRTGGAQIVEGPSPTGILGVMPLGIVERQTPTASANMQLRGLSARLRADPRVLWVQPLAGEGTLAARQAQDARDHRAPDAREH